VSRAEVLLALSDTATLLRKMKLPGVDVAVQRAKDTDPEHLSFAMGSWPVELQAACADLRDRLGDLPVERVALAKVMKLKLPELPELEKLIKIVTKTWEARPGVLRG
jgi:hypothetical protein